MIAGEFNTPALGWSSDETCAVDLGVTAISGTLHTEPGTHSWQFASSAFAAALPWLSTRLGAG